MRVLNLYAGIGGNRKLWGGVEVTAIEMNPKIGAIYRDFFPNDKLIITDAHKYLLNHYNEYDFIWSSPPCPSHSRVRKATQHQNKPIYPDLKLYEEILFLQGYYKKRWVVENVIGWYDPLIKPYVYREHYYWSNFYIGGEKKATRYHESTIDVLQDKLGISLEKYKGINKILALRNCVEPEAGLYIFNQARDIETKLDTDQLSLL
tara:strand:+ start:696 stop:1310 length:615 start_codon:yes stop_codon:yes gene_type:complete